MSGNLESNNLSHINLMRLMQMMHEQGEPGYNLDWGGICRGTASMAMQAILAGKFHKFCKRLKRISDFIVSEEMQELEKENGFKENFLTREDTTLKKKNNLLSLKRFLMGLRCITRQKCIKNYLNQTMKQIQG